MRLEQELSSKAKHDPKLIQTYIRNKMDVKRSRLSVNRSKIADILSNQFESVFVKESLEPLPEFKRITSVSFGIERVLNKIDENEIERK